MRLGYYNQKVEKIFLDFGKMGKKIPAEWVRKIKQHLDRLAAAETFADFLTLVWVSQNGLKAIMARSSSPFMFPLMSD